jgi:hypothetical protein
MIAAATLAGAVVFAYLARAWRWRRRRNRLIAERLHWLALRDERAAQTTLRPRTGDVVASGRFSPNGNHQ